MKNIRHLMATSKGQGTTTNSAEQQQNIRHNHQYYGFTAKATARQNEKAMAYFLPPLPVSFPSLTVPHTLPPSIFLSSSEKQFVLNKLPWLNKVCSLCPHHSLSHHIWMGGWVT